MKKFLIIVALFILTIALGEYLSLSEEAPVITDNGGGIIVKTGEDVPEQAPPKKDLTIMVGEIAEEVNSVFYKSPLGYSTYIIEKFEISQGDSADQIVSETFPQNKMIVTLMPEGSEVEALCQKVEEDLSRNYSQVSALRETLIPVKSLQVDALDGVKEYTRIFILDINGSVYKIELFFDNYGSASMLPRFYAMIKEMRF